jgi:hypothetical protein
MQKNTFTPSEHLLREINAEGMIFMKKLRSLETYETSWDQKSPWVKELLLELNEKAEDLSDTLKLENSQLQIHLQFQKKQKMNSGDYLICELHVNTQFLTHCSQSFQLMKDNIEFSLKACFLHPELTESEECKDQTEYFTDGAVYELYFLNEVGNAPLKELVHEQLFLNLNYFPVLESPEHKIELK